MSLVSGGDINLDDSPVGQTPEESDLQTVLKPSDDHEVNEVSDDDSEAPNPPVAANGHSEEIGEKRVRKKVQRLSETLSKAHDEKVEQRAKAAKEIFEGGSGTALGDIPRIESALRKLQPISLKPLHLLIYGRLGTVNEVRSNLRKFRGFAFKSGSPEYDKKLAQIEQRPMNEVREALRILSLEVSGTREVIAARLLEFCLHPSADKVKNKGKTSTSRRSIKKGTKKPKSKSSAKKTPSKIASSEGSGKDISHTEDDEASNISSDDSISDEHSSEEEYVACKNTARSKNTSAKRPAKRRVSINESESEPDTKESAKQSSSKRPKMPAKSAVVDSDEDTPLSAFASSKKTTFPSDSELKDSIIELLKTVNLEETSLKVVREQIFARYPGVDLTGKKDFINTTVKEYLAQS